MSIQWKQVTWYSQLFAIVLFVGVFVLGFYLGAAYNEAISSPVLQPIATSTPITASSTVKVVKQPVVNVKPASTTVATSTSKEVRFDAYLTAYTYWDNTPPGSSEISNPIIHQKAGGIGTFNDPITVAVGHSFAGGTHTLDYTPGTKFYLPYLKKYFIVEDICGDGDHPENGPCHTGYQGYPWFDLWIDGVNGNSSTTNSCAEAITEIHMIIQHPAPNYAVVPGAVYNNGCAEQFSDTPVAI